VDARLGTALAEGLGSPVKSARPLSGGDINQAFEVTLGDRRRVFVKTNPSSPRGMFAAEAKGLGWLASARSTLRIPRVVAVSAPDAAAQYLALEMIDSARQVADFDEQLGRGLAELHRRAPSGFGLDHDNFVGRLPQSNTPEATWAEFYRTRRLGAQLRAAADAGLASGRMKRGFDRLFAALDDLVAPAEPPARLHGDLWGGNLLCDDRGLPCMIDAAVYGGHREIDFEMMRLFGGFSARVFAAYDEAWPLADGHGERVTLYQLYPLMVHVNLFGGGYVGSVESALDRLA